MDVGFIMRAHDRRYYALAANIIQILTASGDMLKLASRGDPWDAPWITHNRNNAVNICFITHPQILHNLNKELNNK